MANAKVSTEETILRDPTDTPANADANTVRIYTDGTSVYSKDSSGTIVSLSSGGFDATADVIVIGNDTGGGSNSIHLKSGGSGTDSITVGSGASGSPDTEEVLVHSVTELNIESGATINIESGATINVESETINIGADSTASSPHTINIGADTNHADTINIGGRGAGHDTINIGVNSGSGTDTVTIGGESLIILDLPTSDPVVAGALWNDSGTLKISAG